MGGVEPNSKSIVNGIVTSRPGDLGGSSDVVTSSARMVGSESVPVEVEEEGSLELPPKRPLILSVDQSAGYSEHDFIPLPTFDGVLLDLADSNSVGDGNETGLGEGNGGLDDRVDISFLGQVGEGFGNTTDSCLKDPLWVITGWGHSVNRETITRTTSTYMKGVFLYNNLIAKSFFLLKVNVFLLPVLEPGGKMVELIVLGDPPSLGSVG